MRAIGATPNRHDDEGRGPVVDARRVAGGHAAPVRLERRPQSGERLGARVGAYPLVMLKPDRVALALRYLDWQELLRERAVAGGPGGLVVAGRRECILVLTRHTVAFSHGFARQPHAPIFHRAPEPIVNHRIDHLGAPHPQPVTGVQQHMGAVAHRFHTPGDRDVDVAGRDAL